MQGSLEESKMAVCIIMPALNPDKGVIKYIDGLMKAGLNKIIVVNDGSDSEHDVIFDEIAQRPECNVIRHPVNLGKGRALKDAFEFYLTSYEKEYKGVITVDSDGQHTIDDVIKIAKILEKKEDKLILGTRDFNQSNVPWKSSFGNKMTSAVVKLLWGEKISDTQTGLRGIPNRYLREFLTVPGERFEYEMNMLLYCITSQISIYEETIHTIYENNNKSTHFDPVKDSLRIYKLIFGTFFKYIFSSLSASIIDLLTFQILILIVSGAKLQNQILIATVIARIISSIHNYLLNAHLVFKTTEKISKTIVGYYLLAIVQMLCSWVFVYLLATKLQLPKVVIKMLVDTALFFISYRIQKKYIFSERV